jgi:hypothetical protein
LQPSCDYCRPAGKQHNETEQLDLDSQGGEALVGIREPQGRVIMLQIESASRTVICGYGPENSVST